MMNLISRIKKKLQRGWGRFTLIIYSDLKQEPKKFNFNFFIIIFPFLMLLTLIIFLVYDRMNNLFIKEELKEKYNNTILLIHSFSLSLENKRKKIQSLEKNLVKLFEFEQKKHKISNQTLFLKSSDYHFVIEKQILTIIQINQLLSQYLLKEFSSNTVSLWHKSYIYRIIPKGIPMYPGTFNITSGYGARENPFAKYDAEFHYGLDFASGKRNPILASSDGLVIKVTNEISGGYGYYVQIHHGLGFKTLYAHCSEILVQENQFVKKKDMIALVGMTGRATGNHLHYEVNIGIDKPVDPATFVKIK